MKIIKITALSLVLASVASCASETKETSEPAPAGNVTIINEVPEKLAVEAEVDKEGSSITIEADEDGKVSGSVDIDL
jgi:Skp family chaperone for outer membrane proteins